MAGNVNADDSPSGDVEDEVADEAALRPGVEANEVVDSQGIAAQRCRDRSSQSPGYSA